MKKEDWIKKSLKILSQKGHTAVKIDTLCRELKLTKGSFYHHFKNREDLSKQMLIYWKKNQQTENSVTNLIDIDKRALLKITKKILVKNEDKIERAIRFWGFYDNKVKKILTTLDKDRLHYISTLLIQLGITPKKAKKMAIFHLAAITGAAMLDGSNQITSEGVNKVLIENIKLNLGTRDVTQTKRGT